MHEVMKGIPRGATSWQAATSGMDYKQTAEIRRFVSGDYDVVLGMLERRLDGDSGGDSSTRRTIRELLSRKRRPASLHRTLMRLSDRGGATAIVTTNFDLLLEKTAIEEQPLTYALGGIPRPGTGTDFAGVLHIHGALSEDKRRYSDLVLSDRDFGEFYLRRRVVPDFIYDAARLYNIVLIGYSANDPPMRYLLNAVAADGSRFKDLKERFTFVGSTSHDEASLEDWRGRGITPIPYDSANSHSQLPRMLKWWADLSPICGSTDRVDTQIRRITKRPRASTPDADRDLFDHLLRRSDTQERTRLTQLASSAGASFDWLDAITKVASEPSIERLP